MSFSECIDTALVGIGVVLLLFALIAVPWLLVFPAVIAVVAGFIWLVTNMPGGAK